MLGVVTAGGTLVKDGSPEVVWRLLNSDDIVKDDKEGPTLEELMEESLETDCKGDSTDVAARVTGGGCFVAVTTEDEDEAGVKSVGCGEQRGRLLDLSKAGDVDAGPSTTDDEGEPIKSSSNASSPNKSETISLYTRVGSLNLGTGNEGAGVCRFGEVKYD